MRSFHHARALAIVIIYRFLLLFHTDAVVRALPARERRDKDLSSGEKRRYIDANCRNGPSDPVIYRQMKSFTRFSCSIIDALLPTASLPPPPARLTAGPF